VAYVNPSGALSAVTVIFTIVEHSPELLKAVTVTRNALTGSVGVP
jgi:hypothetical protein